MKKTLSLIMLLLAGAVFVNAETRVALVIGNGAYPNSPLVNPANDARDIADRLKKQQFDVSLVLDGSKYEMETAVRSFTDKLSAKDTVALFYYSGHGIQYGGENYLIPSKSDIKHVNEISSNAFPLNFLYSKLQDTNAGTNIIILDACRNNPFSGSMRSGERGLSVASRQPPQSIIVYATAPGDTASDGTGRNGAFTAALLKHIDDPIDVEIMLRSVRDDVKKATNNTQVPWTNSSLSEAGFSFAGKQYAGAQAVRVNGDLVVSTLTDGELFIDNQPLGAIKANTPKKISGVAAGSHAVRIRYARTEETLNVSVFGGVIADAKFVYTYIPEGTLAFHEWPAGTLVTGTDNQGRFVSLQIHTDNKVVTQPHFSPGLNSVEFTNPVWPKSIIKKIEVKAEKETAVVWDGMPLSFKGLPEDTQVFIEDKPLGVVKNTTVSFDVGEFPPGTYKVSFSGPLIESKKIDVTIETNKPAVVSPEIKKVGILRLKSLSHINDNMFVTVTSKEGKVLSEGLVYPGGGASVPLDTASCVITARRAPDTDTAWRSVVEIPTGLYTDVTLPEIGWSPSYQKAKIREEKAAYVEQLAQIPAQQKIKKKWAWSTLSAGAVSIIGAVASGVMGKTAYDNYNDAYYSTDIAAYRSEAEMWSALTVSCIAVASVSFITSAVSYATIPTSTKIEQSIAELDRKILKLAVEEIK